MNGLAITSGQVKPNGRPVLGIGIMSALRYFPSAGIVAEGHPTSKDCRNPHDPCVYEPGNVMAGDPGFSQNKIENFYYRCAKII
jgi:hypothetical protein